MVDRLKVRKRRVPSVGISFVGESTMTQQSFKDQCDINRILNQYKRTNVIAHTAAVAGRFEDLPDAMDYQQSLNQVMAATAIFGGLPAQVRRRFDNDPEKLLRFLEDPKNREEASQLGLLGPVKPTGEAPEGGVPVAAPVSDSSKKAPEGPKS